MSYLSDLIAHMRVMIPLLVMLVLVFAPIDTMLTFIQLFWNFFRNLTDMLCFKMEFQVFFVESSCRYVLYFNIQ